MNGGKLFLSHPISVDILKGTQQIQNICITFIQRRPNVFDVGPTLYKCYANVLRLLDIDQDLRHVDQSRPKLWVLIEYRPNMLQQQLPLTKTCHQFYTELFLLITHPLINSSGFKGLIARFMYNMLYKSHTLG